LYEARQSLVEATVQGTSTSSPEQTIESLRTIVDDYGHTPAAAQAHWQLGHLYFARGDYAAALTAYEQVQRQLPRDHELSSVLATLDIAYAQEASEACDKALAKYDMVQQSSAIWLHGEAYLGMGRCYEQRHATDQAIAVYERALADGNVMAAARQTISERLARLQPVAKTSSAEQSQAPETEPSATPVTDDMPAAAPGASEAMPNKEPNTGVSTTNP
jgi:tetratricopeptide (TPR) repeat protein